MLIKGKAFEVTFDYEYTDGQLKLYTGASNVSCITRFRPVVFSDAQIVYKLLHALHHYRLCCFLAGSFALFLAARLNFYDGIAIFVAMTDFKITPALCRLFQRSHPPTQSFQLDGVFAFTLTNADDANWYLYHYMVTYKDVRVPVSIVGINTTKHYGPLSNIDLVHFVWENFYHFSYKKYALALSPQGSAPSELVFLKITGLKVTRGKIRQILTIASTFTEARFVPFTHAICLTTARVRFVRGSLRLWPLVPNTSSSITRCISTGFNSISITQMIDTCTRPVRIVCRGSTCFHQRPP